MFYEMKNRSDRDRYGRVLALCLFTYLVLAGPIMGFTMYFPCAEPTLPRIVELLYQPLFFVMAFNGDSGAGMWQCGAFWSPRMHHTWVTVTATVLDLLVLCIGWGLIMSITRSKDQVDCEPKSKSCSTDPLPL